jgi:hypothetical protein
MRKVPVLLMLMASELFFMSCARPTQGGASPQQARPPTTFNGAADGRVLLFNGVSSWQAEVDSLADTMMAHGTGYDEVNSAQLDALSLDDLGGYRLLIIPGGYAPSITNSLSKDTHARLRQAVQERGMSYLGFCAGAWLAVAPKPGTPDGDVSYGIGLFDGPLETETSMFKAGKEFAVTSAAFPDGSHRDLLWYGGPITPDLPGAVVTRYADGTPAISQLTSGRGFVIVSGLHPTANALIMNALGLKDAQIIDPDFAWQLIESALEQRPLPAFQ